MLALGECLKGGYLYSLEFSKLQFVDVGLKRQNHLQVSVFAGVDIEQIQDRDYCSFRRRSSRLRNGNPLFWSGRRSSAKDSGRTQEHPHSSSYGQRNNPSLPILDSRPYPYGSLAIIVTSPNVVDDDSRRQNDANGCRNGQKQQHSPKGVDQGFFNCVLNVEFHLTGSWVGERGNLLFSRASARWLRQQYPGHLFETGQRMSPKCAPAEI